MVTFIRKLLSSKTGYSNHLDYISPPDAASVNAYYERETEMYLKTYGTIIQAARPSSDEEFISYLSASMGLKDGMKVIDGGCGVCGPSIALAQKHRIHIEGITLNKTHKQIADSHIRKLGLEDRINITRGDFANLDTIYEHQAYDLVFFLEVLGYAQDLYKVMESSVRVLKPNGSIYIKDFFPVPIVIAEHQGVQKDFLREIKEQYDYRVLDLINLIHILRKLGLYVEFIRTVNLVEDFTKASQFEQLNPSHNIYTKAIHNPFQLFEPLELRFRKIP